MYTADSINLENACNALESMARQQAPRSPELGAIELAAHALIFITAPRPSDEADRPQMTETLPLAMKGWSSQGHLLEAYLASWKENVARHGTEEQRTFIAYIEQPESHEFATRGDAHDMETRPFADILPEPNHALRILETLAERYAADSLNRVRVDLAIYALRYIVECNQIDALGRFLDDAEKCHEPFDNA
jgi:hypothetical protein